MYEGYYRMGIVNPSTFTIINMEEQEQNTIELSGSYVEQMQQIGKIVHDKNITKVYVSNKVAISLKRVLNEYLNTQYRYQPVEFIYRKA